MWSWQSFCKGEFLWLGSSVRGLKTGVCEAGFLCLEGSFCDVNFPVWQLGVL